MTDALSYGPALRILVSLFAGAALLALLWAVGNWRRASQAPAPPLEPERTARDGWQRLQYRPWETL